MSNHLGDTNKMVRDTPRTDAEECEMFIGVSTFTPGDVQQAFHFARQLERELNAAHQRIKRLEEWKEISLERIQALVDLTARQAANIKRLEEAGDALLWYFCPKNTGDISFLQSEAIKQWNKAKEAKL